MGIGSKNSTLCLRSLPLSPSLPHSGGETVIDHGRGRGGKERGERGGKQNLPCVCGGTESLAQLAFVPVGRRKVEISRIRSDPPNNPAIIDRPTLAKLRSISLFFFYRNAGKYVV